MRKLFSLTALLLAAEPAHAQEPPTALPLGAAYRDGQFEETGDVDRYAYRLEAGKDYAAMISTAASNEGVEIRLRAPNGTVIAKTGASGSWGHGFGVRAKATGKHLLEIANTHPGAGYPIGYRFRFMTDCRAAPSTLCRIKPNTPQQRQWVWAYDDDWHHASLKAGRTYAVAVEVSGAPAESVGWPTLLTFRDRRGKVLAQTEGSNLSFQPRSDGRYFVTTQGTQDAGAPYKITLTVR